MEPHHNQRRVRVNTQVPEMVPFRMTQNIVDSFGVAGVEGAFRKCCECTLQVGWLMRLMVPCVHVHVVKPHHQPMVPCVGLPPLWPLMLLCVLA
jgi:hypothetical protein